MKVIAEIIRRTQLIAIERVTKNVQVLQLLKIPNYDCFLVAAQFDYTSDVPALYDARLQRVQAGEGQGLVQANASGDGPVHGRQEGGHVHEGGAHSGG